MTSSCKLSYLQIFMVGTNDNDGTRKSANDIVVQRSTPLGQNLILTKKITLILKNNEERKKKRRKNNINNNN